MERDVNENIIEEEIRDLDGLLSDLYQRVAASNPVKAQEIATALHRNAETFARAGRGTY